MLIVYIRVESAYRTLKQYLSSKKTQGNLFTTQINIEDTVINQVYYITVKDSSECDYVPLDLDCELFYSVFDIVTQHACQKV